MCSTHINMYVQHTHQYVCAAHTSICICSTHINMYMQHTHQHAYAHVHRAFQCLQIGWHRISRLICISPPPLITPAHFRVLQLSTIDLRMSTLHIYHVHISINICVSAVRTGWRRPIGCSISWVTFRKLPTNYRGFMRKMTKTKKAACESLPPCIHVQCRVE